MRVDGPVPGRLREAVVDAGLGLAVAVAWLAGFHVLSGGDWLPVDPGAWRVAGVSLGVAVAARRAAGPWLVAGLALAYPLVYFRPLVSYFHLVPLLVLGFGGAQRGARRTGSVVGSALVGVAVVAAVGIFFSPVVEASSRAPDDVIDVLRAEPLDQFRPSGPVTFDGPGRDPSGLEVPKPLVRLPTNWSGLALAEFAALSAVLLGAAMARQRQVSADLADRNAELERLRRVEADRAVADERLRISRDLHDVVAHHLTAILMRSQAADRVRASRPDEAHEAVAWIAEESRDALRATRATIASLRDDAPAVPAADGELVADLGQIVARVGQVGLDARLDVRWAEEPALAPPVAVAVQRVVQEALTNVLKHARATQAQVVLRDVQGGLGIDVVDDGQGRSGPADVTGPGGAGLLGMQERLASCGGRLRYGPTEAGGWRVRLWVPILAGPPPRGVAR